MKLISLNDIEMRFENGSLFKKSGDIESYALRGVNFSLSKGEIVGLVGESGSGKTTVGRIAIGLLRPSKGKVYFKDEDVWEPGNAVHKKLRKETRMIFQNLDAVFNPHMKIYDSLFDVLKLHTSFSKGQIDQRIGELMEIVNLPLGLLQEYPHTLSGGQKRRGSIARAIAVPPEIIIADEPVSALDVSMKTQITDLLKSINNELNVTILFISHDIEILASLCTRIAVMKDGEIVEQLPINDFVQRKIKHPYTRLLLESILSIDQK